MEKELRERYGINCGSGSGSEDDDGIITALMKDCLKTREEAHFVHEEIFDYLQDLAGKHKFSLEDLSLYCLNPEDLRLIHEDEKGHYGGGFNILERSYARRKNYMYSRS